MRHRSLLTAPAPPGPADGPARPRRGAARRARRAERPRRPSAFTYQDMITANRLGDPQVSPDGR